MSGQAIPLESRSRLASADGARDALEGVHHLVERRAGVDLRGGPGAQQRLDVGQVMQDQIALHVAATDMCGRGSERLSEITSRPKVVRLSGEMMGGARIELATSCL